MPPLTDGAAAGTWRGETEASGIHGVDVAVGLARMLLPGVPMVRPDTTGWRGPLAKARSWEVKGLDLVACPKRRHASSVHGPLTDGAAAGTWRGETDVSGLHGGDLAVGLARVLLQSVPMG